MQIRTGAGLQAHPEERPAESPRFADIQVLRGVAIILVLLRHLALPIFLLQEFLPGVTHPGYVGVELFFVISGFVVTRSLMRQSYEPVGFLVRRVFRLYPALIAALILGAGTTLVLRQSDGPYQDFIRQTLLPSSHTYLSESLSTIGGYYINQGPPHWQVNGALWSLSVEFQYYGALLLACGVMALVGLKARRRSQALFGLALVVYAVGCIERFSLWLNGLHEVWPVLAGPQDLPFYIVKWGFDFLALGMLLAFAPQRLANATGRLFGRLTPFVLLALALLIPALGGDPNRFDVRPVIGLGFAAMGVLFGLLVLTASSTETPFALPQSLRSFLGFVGDRSYTYYVIHLALLALIGFVFLQFLPKFYLHHYWCGTLEVAWLAVSMTLLGELMFRRLEQPMIGAGARVLKALRRERHISPAPALAEAEGTVVV